jgi:Ca2+:H+ antiporter
MRYNVEKKLIFRFIGLILLPLVGNAAEHVTSVWMACKGKMELTIGVSVGSSIQIAAGMIPLLVLIAWPMGKNLTLFFVSFSFHFGIFSLSSSSISHVPLPNHDQT